MPTRADRGMENYNFQTNKTEVCGVGSVPTDCGVAQSKRLFAPRVGLAWRPNEDFVIRAGYGITVDPYSLARPMRTNYPLLVVLNVSGANAFQAAGRLRDGIPAIPEPNLGNGIIDIAPHTRHQRLQSPVEFRRLGSQPRRLHRNHQPGQHRPRRTG